MKVDAIGCESDSHCDRMNGCESRIMAIGCKRVFVGKGAIDCNQFRLEAFGIGAL